MNNKFILIFCTIIFVIVTAIVVATNSNSMNKMKIVQFNNQLFNISNKKSTITSGTKVTINNSPKEFSNKNIKIDNENSKMSNQNISYENENINNDNQTVKIDFKNLDDTKLNEMLKHPNASNNNVHFNNNNNYNNKPNNINNEPIKNVSVPKQIDRYLTKQIDWNTWKNNFRNKILDDSIDLTYLDTYPMGSSLYYSFTVDSSGAISDIVVTSGQLSVRDKLDFREFIKSYQYKPITKFPPYTNIKKQKVSATIILSDTTEHANFKEFNGIEHVKIKY